MIIFYAYLIKLNNDNLQFQILYLLIYGNYYLTERMMATKCHIYLEELLAYTELRDSENQRLCDVCKNKLGTFFYINICSVQLYNYYLHFNNIYFLLL